MADRISEKPTVFIAHSTEDLLDARLVRNAFEDLMHDVLLLKLSQQMSEDYLKNLLRNEILARDWLVVVVSQNSRRSNWVNFEQDYAEERGKPIFYVELEDCAHLHDRDREECLQGQVEAISRIIRVFLSYHTQDTPFARRIAGDLRIRGYEVGLDIERLEEGINFAKAVEEAIDRTLERGAVVLLASKDGVQSEFVLREFSYALRRGGRVIPCIIEPRPRRMPHELQAIQWIDFTKSYEEGLKTLLSALG